MPEPTRCANIFVVLYGPRYPENIGAAARAVCNMGMGGLVVVAPENFDENRVLKMATHAAAGVVETAAICETLDQALGEFGYVVGTTARLGGQRRNVCTPRDIAQRLVPIARENRVAVLFGPEDKGLPNDAVRYCHSLVNIPTAGFSSLNLAQAVMILCYEIFSAGWVPQSAPPPRLATHRELEAMYDQLKGILVRIDFIQRENPDYWMNNLRRFFSRLPLRAKEVRILRGIFRQIDWYAKKCFLDGKQGNPPDWD